MSVSHLGLISAGPIVGMIAVLASLGAPTPAPIPSIRPAPIPSIRLNNGVSMPMVSLGTWQYNSSVAQDVVKAGLGAGFSHIDTAWGYYNQDGVGAALKGVPRESYFLTTKVPDCGRLGGCADHYKNTSDAVAYDLQRLGVDHVDLMLIHWPPATNKARANGSATPLDCHAVQEDWRALEDIYAAGKARAIGVSNYCPSALQCLMRTAKVTPAVNQVMYHIGMGPDPGGIKTFCDSLGIRLQSYSPLGDGTLELITGKMVSDIGKAHGVSGASVSLRWATQHGVPLSTKSSSPKHLAEDVAIYSFALSDDEMATLDAAATPASDFPQGSYSFMCAI